MFSTRRLLPSSTSFLLGSSITSTTTVVSREIVSRRQIFSSSSSLKQQQTATSSSNSVEQLGSEIATNTTTINNNKPSASTSTTAFCILCDEHVHNWQAHASDTKHVARFAVAQELCAPERNAAMLAQLWDHIRLDFNAVDVASEQRVRRRRRRLSSTAKYLRDVHILQDCLLFENVFVPASSSSHSTQGDITNVTETVDATSNATSIIEKIFFDLEGNERSSEQVEKILLSEVFTVAPSFAKLVHVGERASRAELMDRCARLFPASTAAELESIVGLIMSPLSMATMFDLLDLKDVVYTRYRFDKNKNNGQQHHADEGEIEQQQQQFQNTTITALPVTKNQETLHLVALPDFVKRQIILAILGELSLWNTRDRPTSVGTKQDADTIVTHVLALHVVENILSELLHHSLQKVVDETTPVWREFKDSMTKFVMTSNRPNMKLDQQKKPSVEKSSDSNKKMTGTEALNFLTGKRKEDGNSSENSSDTTFETKQDVFSFFSSIMSDATKHQTGRNAVSGVSDVSSAAPPQPKIIWRTMQIEGVLAASVPQPAEKTAMFAMMKPQLNQRAKIGGGVSSIPNNVSSSTGAASPNTSNINVSHVKPKVIHPGRQQHNNQVDGTTTVNISLDEIVAQEVEAAAKEKKLEEQRKRNEQAAKIIAEAHRQQTSSLNDTELTEEQKKQQQLNQELQQRHKQKQEQQQQLQQKQREDAKKAAEAVAAASEAKSEIKKPQQQQQNAPKPAPNISNQTPIKPRTPSQARAPPPPSQQPQRPGFNSNKNAPPPPPQQQQQQQQKIVTMSTLKVDPNRKMRLQPVAPPPKPKN